MPASLRPRALLQLRRCMQAAALESGCCTMRPRSRAAAEPLGSMHHVTPVTGHMLPAGGLVHLQELLVQCYMHLQMGVGIAVSSRRCPSEPEPVVLQACVRIFKGQLRAARRNLRVPGELAGSRWDLRAPIFQLLDVSRAASTLWALCAWAHALACLRAALHACGLLHRLACGLLHCWLRCLMLQALVLLGLLHPAMWAGLLLHACMHGSIQQGSCTWALHALQVGAWALAWACAPLCRLAGYCTSACSWALAPPPDASCMHEQCVQIHLAQLPRLPAI